ncbi:hypothetical protein GCM10028771_17130 [Nocardioides marmoraquaticus]
MRWVRDYERLWRSPGTEGLSEVFTPEAEYVASPWAEPVTGLAALADFWEAEREGPDEEFRLRAEVVAVDGATGIVRVEVDYPDDRWRDLWVLRFADDGRCRHFEEWPFAPATPDGHPSTRVP